jgi:hypothetical protein
LRFEFASSLHIVFGFGFTLFLPPDDAASIARAKYGYMFHELQNSSIAWIWRSVFIPPSGDLPEESMESKSIPQFSFKCPPATWTFDSSHASKSNLQTSFLNCFDQYAESSIGRFPDIRMTG